MGVNYAGLLGMR